MSWASPENDAGIETYVTDLATGATGSGGALTGRMTVGTKVYAVSGDTGSAGKSHVVVHTKSTLAELSMPMALAPTGVSKSVSAVSYSDLDLGANAVALAVGTTVYGISGASSDTDLTSRSHVVVCTKSTLAGQTMPAALALTDVAKGVSAVPFDDLDLDANHVGGGVSWASPEDDAGIETYVTNLATGAASSGGALMGRMAVGTKVYAVASDTGSAGKSHVVVHTKSTLAELTAPMALAPS